MKMTPLSIRHWLGAAPNPSYVAAHPSGQTLYSVCEAAAVGDNKVTVIGLNNFLHFETD